MKTLPALLPLCLLSLTAVACGDFDPEHGGMDGGGELVDPEGEDDRVPGGGGDGGAAGGGGDSGGEDVDHGDFGADDGCDDCDLPPGPERPCDDDDDDDDGPALGCLPTHTPFIAGQHYDAGWVTVTTVDEGLRIDIDAESPWVLNAVHVFAGTTAPGSNPGSYPVGETLDHASTYGTTLSFEQLGASCGDSVLVAVHAEVSKPIDDQTCQQETAWAEGDLDFAQGWGSYLRVKICCD